MYRVLLAEDSKPIMRNLMELITTSGLPVQIVHTASNGADALAAFNELEVDILLTDIRMPKMDGLALIGEAKKINSRLKAVLISGYNDFEYTRKAINLQVSDYLLKPIERSALIEVIEKVIAQIREEYEAEFTGLSGIIDPAAGPEQMLGTEFFRDKKLVLMMQLQYFCPSVLGWEPEQVQDLLGRAFAPHPFWVFAAKKPRLLLTLTDPAFLDEAGPMERLEDIRAALEEAGMSASIAGRFYPVNPKEFAGCSQALSELLDSRMTIAEPVLADEAHSTSRSADAAEDAERIAARYVDMISKLQKEPFLLQFSEQLAKWGKKNLRIALLHRIVEHLVNAFPSLEKNYGEFHSSVQRLYDLPSYTDFCAGLLDLFEQRFTEEQSLNKKGGYELFRKIDAHLKSNLYTPLSMNDLAVAFHVSPSYISRVMKKHSNTTLMQYYLDLKIAEARKVIRSNPTIKIKELSDALCFYDQHYFSKVFKEYSGCSPTEYKVTVKGHDETKQD
ncbi:response regulator [Paenibacillus glycanilyticus]|uniref:response regulator transcription factor n=1 Tax=Paenibacillus glycanilyticus TaxID=126569 RepID=UPI00203BFC4E|nr:response regulator [Paenibacillus glycanilyticus]MCM3631609.1 response regulator [Paenibacillus glycanilyticus]